MSVSDIARHFRLHQAVLRELGHELAQDAAVLDFGCGAGAMVAEYRRHGFAAYGCDPRCQTATNELRPMPDNDIPFPDNSFDFVFSDQVLEHVQDHAHAVAEIRRVLRPGGVSLHIFPARWKPLESHVNVPFAGVCQRRAWLVLWAYLGVRTAAQRGKPAREVAALNHEYLTTRTNYLAKPALRRLFARQFGAVTFAEKQLLQHTYGGARRLAPLARHFPPVAALYGSWYSRVIFVRKQ